MKNSRVKINIYRTLFVLGCLMTSCKEKEVELSKTQFLCKQSWVIVTARSQTNGGAWYDPIANLPLCDKDNKLTFTSSNSTYVLDEGPTTCGSVPSEVLATGTWQFNTDESKILFTRNSVTTSVDILQLDANVLKTRTQRTTGTNIYVEEITYGHP